MPDTAEKKPKAPVTRERVHRSVKIGGAAAVVAAASALGAFLQPFIAHADPGSEKLAVVEKRLTVVETVQTAQDRRLERMENKLDRIWERVK